MLLETPQGALNSNTSYYHCNHHYTHTHTHTHTHTEHTAKCARLPHPHKHQHFLDFSGAVWSPNLTTGSLSHTCPLLCLWLLFHPGPVKQHITKTLGFTLRWPEPVCLHVINWCENHSQMSPGHLEAIRANTYNEVALQPHKCLFGCTFNDPCCVNQPHGC